MKEKEVRKSEAMVLLTLLRERLDVIELALERDNTTRAEAEILVAQDLMRSLKITIRRLQRL